MEYCWELRSKNAQNIKALMCPLYEYNVQNYSSISYSCPTRVCGRERAVTEAELCTYHSCPINLSDKVKLSMMLHDISDYYPTYICT